MRNVLHVATLTILATLLNAGCQGEAPPFPRSDTDAQLFGPVAMRLHPIFTQVKDWSGDDKPDGIEALVELQDQFGDPTKASGRVIFELYEYRPHSPERRGERLLNPWIGDLETLDDQRDRWNRTSRTYGFQLTYPDVQPTRSYVLTAQFELSNGGRFFDRIILEGRRPRAPDVTAPTTAPAAPPDALPQPPANAPVVAPSGAPDAGPGPRTPEP